MGDRHVAKVVLGVDLKYIFRGEFCTPTLQALLDIAS
jgi:hypothetical protein